MLIVGQLLNNRYRILESLGRGGMGSVFKARDDTLNRFVAVKELRIDPGASPQVRAQIQQQFRQEAQVLANMHHPNLPRVTDYFTAGGSEYLVMDFIEGRSLGALLQTAAGKPFDEVQVLNWARQLLEALAYSHSRGVIHRDIKPQNLILTPDGRVILVDFGLAKLYNPDEEIQTKTVLRGLGTPEYAPPEQYDSASGHTDPRSDIYSLGATLYHLLTGQTPPTATQRMVNPANFVLPPSWHTMVSPTTQSVVMRAMRIPRAERFNTIAEVIAALFPGGLGAYNAAPGSLTGTTTSAGSSSILRKSGSATPLSGHLQSTDKLPSTSVDTYGMFALAALMALAVIGGSLVGTARLFAAFGNASPTPHATPIAALTPDTGTATTTAGASPVGTPASTPASSPSPLPTTASGTRLRPLDGGTMLLIPAGSFVMGTDSDEPDLPGDQKPAHSVALEAYWIDQHEVSNAQFQRFIETTGYVTDIESKRGHAGVWKNDAWQTDNGASWRHPNGAETTLDKLQNYPVVQVTWNDAEAFCYWATQQLGQLPTEAQWEKAARGADGQAWPWGAEWDPLRLNYCDANCPATRADTTANDGYAYTAPADAFANGASPYDVLNLSGNVAEWVLDWYASGYYESSPTRDPLGPETGTERVVRGGSWFANQLTARPTMRVALAADLGFANIGFRCAQPAGR